MSRAKIDPRTLLAATISLVGGVLFANLAEAAMEPGTSSDAGNQAGQFTPANETTPSNWSNSFPPPEIKEPVVTTVTSSGSKTSSDSKTSTADSGRSKSRKLPSAVEMLKRFQKGGNPNEIMSNSDDSDTDKDKEKEKDAAGKPISPSLVHNFGPKGVLIPIAGGGAATGDKDEKAEEAAVNKEPAVAPESAEVIAAVHSAYGALSQGKAEDAVATMTAMVKKEPRSMLARRATAFIMLYSGNARESVDQMFVLAGLPNYQPQSFDRCTLGDAYLLLNRPDNALIAFEDALKINSENVQARSGELRSMVLVGRVDEAMTDCVEAYKKAKQPVLQRYYRQLYVSLADARNQINGGAPQHNDADTASRPRAAH